MPFKICHFCISHMDIIHYALALVTLSWLFLCMVISSVVGDSLPMRALKSPTITELAFWGMHPKMSSVIVGDFNARIGELSPTTEEITIPRKSQDNVTNARA